MRWEVVRASLAAGAGGTVAITASTTIEMRLRGRPASSAPADAIERILRRRLDPRTRKVAGTAGHLVSGLVLGLPRALLRRAGIGEPLATALFLPVVWTPDLVVVPGLGVTDPPWRWGAVEIAISGLHHLAYAVGAAVALAALSEPVPRTPPGGRAFAGPRRRA
jgi:hypothetical protein